jgi:hypothetical protein
MKILKIMFFSIVLLSIVACDKPYKTLSSKVVSELIIQDTLVYNKDRIILNVLKPTYKNMYLLLLQNNKNYLFDSDCYLENDHTILKYESAFLIDENGSFRKNGLWIYTKYSKEGAFPFTRDVTHFSVDSIPSNFKGNVPKEEGIYFFKSPNLLKVSKEQSNEKFKEKTQNGFYFLPNSGRLFDRIKIDELD